MIDRAFTDGVRCARIVGAFTYGVRCARIVRALTDGVREARTHRAFTNGFRDHNLVRAFTDGIRDCVSANNLNIPNPTDNYFYWTDVAKEFSVNILQ